MYLDNSLMPKEAVRLAALGALAGGAMPYGELAAEVRDFTSHIMGPSLDVMGTSLELLRYEGLIETEGARGEGEAKDVILRITEAGLEEFRHLLLSAVRAPFNDLNKLVVALKMRFLHLLDAPARRDQADMLVEACECEHARLMSLRRKHADAGGHLIEWLDYDIGQVEDKLNWFRGLRERL
jgi:DNA-binding PadR family transcriptional regulator